MVAGKRWQKKLIFQHSSNEVSLAAAFVPVLTMVRVIWIPLRRAKWPPIVRGERTESEARLSPQCSQSNYDIIFLQDFSKSSRFTQRGLELGWSRVAKAVMLEGVRISQQLSKTSRLGRFGQLVLLVHVFWWFHLRRYFVPAFPLEDWFYLSKSWWNTWHVSSRGCQKVKNVHFGE